MEDREIVKGILKEEHVTQKSAEDSYLKKEDLGIVNLLYKKLNKNEKNLFKDKFINQLDTIELKEKYVINDTTLYKRISRLRKKCLEIKKDLGKECL